MLERTSMSSAIRTASGLRSIPRRMVRLSSSIEDTTEASSPCCTIRRLPAKGDQQLVLAQLLALEKKLFKKADNWGDLLIKETQRRNTFLLYAEAPLSPTDSPLAQEAGAATRGNSTAGTGSNRRTVGGNSSDRAKAKASPAQHPPAQHPPAAAPAVVGYIIFTTTGLNAHISKLAVAPEWRRRGIARSLVKAAVGAARTERRVASVSLHVDADNAPALGLYRSEGFASEALLEDYYCRGRHAHKMRLDFDTSY